MRQIKELHIRVGAVIIDIQTDFPMPYFRIGEFMAKKKFEELNLKDAFLFGAVLEDPETCRISLEVMLGKEIAGVTVHAEHTLFYNSDYRSIRLDIHATDENQDRYNVEMQTDDKKNLPKRSRFHQAEMDVASLKPGEDFQTLRSGYVIFICDFDPFGKGRYRYTFENRCREEDFPLEDGATRIFLSTKGRNPDEVPTELVNFLRYVEESTDDCARQLQDKVVTKIHDRVTALKKSREWERSYMKFEELLQDAEAQGREEGREEGREQGQSRLQKLISKMTEAGEVDKLARLADAIFLQEMYQKYHL